MTIDISRTTEILKEALLRDLGDEVDLIFLCGSYLKGTTHKYSDLDLLYVPVHESTWHSITVLVDDIMIDFYPMHWPRLEEMANFDNVGSSVLLKSQIVYQRSEDVAERFRALPERLCALQQPDARPAMLRRLSVLPVATASNSRTSAILHATGAEYPQRCVALSHGMQSGLHRYS